MIKIKLIIITIKIKDGKHAASLQTLLEFIFK